MLTTYACAHVPIKCVCNSYKLESNNLMTSISPLLIYFLYSKILTNIVYFMKHAASISDTVIDLI